MESVSSIERECFSERLHYSLRKSGYRIGNPTQLRREFNSHFPGSPITVHTAHEWLYAGSIPEQDKMHKLAQWLGVTTQWLDSGGVESLDFEGSTNINDRQLPDKISATLIQEVQRLDEPYRQIGIEFIRMLARMSKQNSGYEKEADFSSGSGKKYQNE